MLGQPRALLAGISAQQKGKLKFGAYSFLGKVFALPVKTAKQK